MPPPSTTTRYAKCMRAQRRPLTPSCACSGRGDAALTCDLSHRPGAERTTAILTDRAVACARDALTHGPSIRDNCEPFAL